MITIDRKMASEFIPCMRELQGVTHDETLVALIQGVIHLETMSAISVLIDRLEETGLSGYANKARNYLRYCEFIESIASGYLESS